MNSGYFLKADLQQSQGRVIPWALTGLLILNLVEALAVSAFMNPSLSVMQRLENCLTAYVCLDVGRMVAYKHADEQGFRRCTRWIAKQTHDNLQELTVLAAISLMGLPGDMVWNPWRNNELGLETFFGQLRGQFSSSQMRARDYLHASAKTQFQTLHKLKKNGCQLHAPDLPCPQAASEDDFKACAKKALGNALHLMACSSESLWHCFIGALGGTV